MASKLAAAKIAAWSGVRAVIAGADRPGVVADAVADVAGVGTVVRPHDRRLPARKLWIAFAVGRQGTVVVDEGARRALIERSVSLLPAGVVSMSTGAFDAGDAVEIAGPDGAVFAKGLVRHAVGPSSATGPAAAPPTSPPTCLTRSSTATTSSLPAARPRNRTSSVSRWCLRWRAGVVSAAGGGLGGRRRCRAGCWISARRAWASRSSGRLLDLEHAGLDRLALELGSAERLGVAGLDLLAHLFERRDVLADRLATAGHRRVHLLLHLRLVELRQELLALGQLLLQGGGVRLHGPLGVVGVLRSSAGALLERLDLALDLR